MIRRRFLRPPGARPEKEFLACCLQCGQCAQACIFDCIRMRTGFNPFPLGTPGISPRDAAFHLCVRCSAISPVLSQISMRARYSRIFQFYFEQSHITLAILFLLGVLMVEFIARKRLWCRYACPQAFLLVIAKLLSPYRLEIGYDHEECLCKKGRDPCGSACSVSLDPEALSQSPDTECTSCGDCVVARKKMGQALSFQFGITRSH